MAIGEHPARALRGVVAVGLAAALAVAAPPARAQSAGLELARQVYQRPDGRDLSVRATMILREGQRAPRVRELFTYRLDRGPGEVWSLVRFVRPADIDGVGLLTRDFPGGRTRQWLYLPALDKVRRIAAQRKGGRFVGSDLFYEDLRDREPAMDRHRLRGEERLDGTLTKVLVSRPVDAANSTYSKRISWIHPATRIALRVDFFRAGRAEPIKRLRVHRVKRIDGYWTVMDSTMTDLRSGHSTRMRIEEAVYDRDLPKTLFSRRALADPKREAAFRP